MPRTSQKQTSGPKKKTSSSSKNAATTKGLRIKRRLASRKENKKLTKKSHTGITGSFRLFADCLSLFRQHWKTFGGITFVYAVLSVVLIGVRGSGIDVGQLKDDAGLGVTFFSLLSGSNGPVSPSGTAYRSIVFFIISLATIWALRQIMAGQKAGIRDSFYKGMYPLVPVALILVVIGLQLVPLMVGLFLLGVGFGGGVAVGFIERSLWFIASLLLVLSTFYMLCSSIFAFYIATLPDMRPMAALRSARKLVRFRRWTVLRKLLFLPFVLLVLGVVATLPFIWFWPVAAQWVFLLLSMVGLIVAHAYLYSLYRELL